MKKFKIGDRVVGNSLAYQHRVGDTGVVEIIDNYKTWVRFDSDAYLGFVRDYEIDLVDTHIPPKLKIEEGKYYKTRGGRKFGPAETLNEGKYIWNIPSELGFYAYTADGKSCLGKYSDDIVEEWPVEEKSKTEELINALEGILAELDTKIGEMQAVKEKALAAISNAKGEMK